MKLAWILSLVAGLGLTAYAGGYTAWGPDLMADFVDYGFAASFAALHVLVWRGEGWFFAVLRFLVWAFDLSLAGLFLWAYFPRGILPILKLVTSGVTLPMVIGLAAVAIAALFRRRTRPAPVAAPAPPPFAR